MHTTTLNARVLIAAPLLLWATVAGAQVASEYSVTDISGWTPAQLAALPYFDRYVPVAPTGASVDFVPSARSGLGVTAGTHTSDEAGAYVTPGGQVNIDPWGSFFWSYRVWDGHDWHYYSGTVSHSPARDVNILGQIVGHSTLRGSGDSSLDYDSHGYLRVAATGEHIDLTPGAHRADLRGINDRGEITGTWSDTNVFHAVRRMPDGREYDFSSPGGSVSPAVINNHGVIAGMVTTYGFPWTYHPFVSTETNAMVQLPYPSQGSPENGDLYDVNDHGIIVGRVYKDAPVETQAVRWYPDGDTWNTDDLNELLADGSEDFILDRCVAINDSGHIIVKGHPDGSDTIATHTLLLTPDVLPKPSVISLEPTHVTSSGAVLRAKVNACDALTTAAFHYGADVSYGATSSVPGSTSGTLPALVTSDPGPLAPHTTYHFRGRATNGQGTTDGADISFTTAWDWHTWATDTLGSADPYGDANGNGAPDLMDYATGSEPSLRIATQSGTCMIVFSHLVAADRMTLVLQVSEDLITWHDELHVGLSGTMHSNVFTTALLREPTTAGCERVTVNVRSGMTALYARLKAILQ